MLASLNNGFIKNCFEAKKKSDPGQLAATVHTNF